MALTNTAQSELAAITASARTDLIALTIGMFNAAPGELYLNDFVLAFDAGQSLSSIANSLATTGAFKEVNPPLQTPQEFAASLATRLLGNEVAASEKTWAQDWIVGQLNAGASRASVILTAVTALRATTNPLFANAKLAFANKIAVAEHYSVTAGQSSTDLVALQGVIASVTSDPATVTAAKTAIDNGVIGVTYDLKAGVDTIPGTIGNDVILGIASDGADATFTGLDVIKGGLGNDTIILNNPTNNFFFPNGVTVEGVETAVLRSANGEIEADVSGWVGLTTVMVEQFDDGEDTEIDTDSNVVKVVIDGGDEVLVEDNGTTTDALATVNLSNIGSDGYIYSDALTNLGLTNVASYISVNNNTAGHVLNIAANKVTGYIEDDVAGTVNVTATGAASTFTLDGTAIKTVTVAGDKAVSLTLAAAAVTSITSTNTIGTTIASTLLAGTAFTGGTGADAVTLGATTKAIAMGAGNDSVTMTALVGTGGSVDGGDGKDTLSVTSDFANDTVASFASSIANFEVLQLGQTLGSSNDVVKMGNFDNINYVISAGTAATTGVGEEQTITVTAADADGGMIRVGDVDISIEGGATAEDVAAAIAAAEADIIAENSDIVSVTAVDDVVTILYSTTSGPQAAITAVQNPSSVTFGATATTSAGVTEVVEQQTITVGTAPIASGVVTVAGVDVQVLLGETTTQTAARIHSALNTSLPSGAASVAVVGNVITVTFASGNSAQAALVLGANATAIFGAGDEPDVVDNAVAYVAPAAEIQTVEITADADADGGAVVIGGASIDLAGGMTIDQIGVYVVSQLAAIQAASPSVEGIGYNTSDNKLTITFTEAAGDVAPITAVDNTTSGSTLTVADDVVAAVAGLAAGTLSIVDLASGGTLELTGGIHGASSVAVKDAGLSGSTSDVLNIKLNATTNIQNTALLTVASVETINIEATDSAGATVNPTAASVIMLAAANAATVNVTGNHGVDFTGSVLGGVTTLNASGVTGTGTAGRVTFGSTNTAAAVTITGGSGNDVLSGATGSTKVVTINGGSGNDTITGANGADVLSGGDGNDTIMGGAGADQLNGGAGNDAFVYTVSTQSVLATPDVVTGFTANTYGNGTSGATGTGAGASGSWTGDVISLVGVGAAAAADGVFSFVAANSADALTFLQNLAADVTPAKDWAIGVALDSSTGNLYIDWNSDGTADSVITLTGVTTINAAAIALTA